MTIREMMDKKIELGWTCEMVAEKSGVPLSTVQKIFSGITKAPRRGTMEALTKALSEAPGRKTRRSYWIQQADGTRREVKEVWDEESDDSGMPGMVMESTAGYTQEQDLLSGTAAVKKDTRYTIEDYYALPEDQRVELIDGVFYDMGAPAMKHQRILGDLHILFRECAAQHGMNCEVYLSPCDVRLDKDNYTMVQPDLLVICHDYDEDAIRYEGAPDLVVEILSPSTRKKDLGLKLYKYMNAGVREYWVIDPMTRRVTVHFFEDGNYSPETYAFDAKIPVGISGGECVIDFSRVRGN